MCQEMLSTGRLQDVSSGIADPSEISDSELARDGLGLRMELLEDEMTFCKHDGLQLDSWCASFAKKSQMSNTHSRQKKQGEWSLQAGR